MQFEKLPASQAKWFKLLGISPDGNKLLLHFKRLAAKPKDGDGKPEVGALVLINRLRRGPTPLHLAREERGKKGMEIISQCLITSVPFSCGEKKRTAAVFYLVVCSASRVAVVDLPAFTLPMPSALPADRN